MLGGAECFHHGKFRNTPVGALLPVHLERPRSTTPAGELRYNLTREGYLEPWARLRESKPEEESRLASMTQFHSANLARTLKPGASLIGSVFDGAENWPAIAVQRFGNGHVAAFTVGDVWRWAFKDPEQRADMEKYWRQLVRWLVADVPNRVSLKFQSDPESGTRDTARVEVRVLDETFRPLNEATVSLTITDPSGETITLSPRLSDKQPGLYEATFVSRNHSFYHAKAEARNPDATPIGDAEEGWTPNLAAEEFKELAPNRALLEEIAAKTGGEVYSFDELGKLASDLPESSVPITRTITKSLWHTPLVFILALVCFGAEWALRRLRGLA